MEVLVIASHDEQWWDKTTEISEEDKIKIQGMLSKMDVYSDKSKGGFDLEEGLSHFTQEELDFFKGFFPENIHQDSDISFQFFNN